MEVVILLHIGAMLVLSVYALHQTVLLLLFLRFNLGARVGRLSALHAEAATGAAREPDENGPGLSRSGLSRMLPRVTVQIPLYNERYVAERVIAAACGLDYPRELLQVQVLDDSTDDTTRIASHAVQTARDHRVNVEYIHRERRDGYKAGALAHGLQTAQGELIAIFDADFVPPRNFLLRVLCEQRVFDDPRVGFVQTRWGHLNGEMTILTRAQSIMLDMSFVIDQSVRSRTGLMLNFNGSGGVWRRAAIDAAGGWQSDTLTEDLDLSFRAQLQGWRGRYLVDVVCPGELPGSVLAFKQQQARWARGSAQCVRKLFPLITRANLPLLHKLAAFIHVSGYFASLFVLLVSLTTPVLMLGANQLDLLPKWFSAIGMIGLLPILSLAVAQAAQGKTLRFMQHLPAVVMLGIGVSMSNSVAVLTGLLGRSSGEFVRTPKSAPDLPAQAVAAKTAVRDRRIAQRSVYTLHPDWTARVELGLGLYGASIGLLLAMSGTWLSIAPILLYAGSFLGVALCQIMPAVSLQLRGLMEQSKLGSRLSSTK